MGQAEAGFCHCGAAYHNSLYQPVQPVGAAGRLFCGCQRMSGYCKTGGEKGRHPLWQMVARSPGRGAGGSPGSGSGHRLRVF